jgi:pimeloyl-ACP methyl ester carboxylesterase
MSDSRPWWQHALRGAGIAGGVAGAAYAAERAVVAGVRRRPDPDAGRELKPPFDEARRIPSHDDGSIYTISRGEGPTVLFAHGVTLDVRLWFKQFEELPERGLRVVAYDQRGHGDSTCGSSGHSVDNLADDLKSVIQGLDLHDVVVVGHSMGGIAAQAFAIRHPKLARRRVRGLVLMSTLAKTHISGSRRLRTLIEHLVEGRVTSASLMAQPHLGFFLTRLGYGRDPQPSHVELNRQMIADCPRDQTPMAIRALLNFDLTADLPTIDLPTLVLSGSADIIAPPAESRRIAELIPDAHLEVFKSAGHMLMFERTDEVNDLIEEFVRDLGAHTPVRRWWPRRRPARPSRRARRGVATRTRVAGVA